MVMFTATQKVVSHVVNVSFDAGLIGEIKKSHIILAFSNIGYKPIETSSRFIDAVLRDKNENDTLIEVRVVSLNDREIAQRQGQIGFEPKVFPVQPPKHMKFQNEGEGFTVWYCEGTGLDEKWVNIKIK